MLKKARRLNAFLLALVMGITNISFPAGAAGNIQSQNNVGEVIRYETETEETLSDFDVQDELNESTDIEETAEKESDNIEVDTEDTDIVTDEKEDDETEEAKTESDEDAEVETTAITSTETEAEPESASETEINETDAAEKEEVETKQDSEKALTETAADSTVANSDAETEEDPAAIENTEIENNTLKEEAEYLCGKTEHIHDEDCVREIKILTDPEVKHEHDISCYKIVKVYVCGEEEHEHDDSCMDVSDEVADSQIDDYLCGLDEHIHTPDCIRKYYTNELLCEEDHEHTEDCYAYEYVLTCGKQEHKHTEDCLEEKEEYIEEEEIDLDEDDVIEIDAAEDEELLADEELSDTTKTMLYEEYDMFENVDGLDDFELETYSAPITKKLKINALKAAPGVQTPVTADGITIEKITMRWLSASTGENQSAGYNDLLIVPENAYLPNQQWQLDLSLSGKGSLDAGAVEIVIPAYIWKTRDGKEPGIFSLAIPREGSSTSADFVWKRVGDQIIITNKNKLSAASKYMVQGTFRMTSPDDYADPSTFDSTYTYEMVDIDTVDDNAEYKGVSDDLYAVVNVTTPRMEELLTMRSNSITAKIDTYVQLSSATKKSVNETNERDTYSRVFTEVPDTLPESLRPENADDYYYVLWYIDGSRVGAQPYTMIAEDVFDPVVNKENKEGETTIEVDGMFLGTTDGYEGTNPAEDPEHLTVILDEFTGGLQFVTNSCYIWSAYRKADFDEEGATYTINNAATVTVTGFDDQITTSQTVNGSVSFRKPTNWTIVKKWNFTPDEMGITDDDERDSVAAPILAIVNEDKNNGYTKETFKESPSYQALTKNEQWIYRAIIRRPEEIFVWVDNKSTQRRREYSKTLSDSEGWTYQWRDDGRVANYEAYEVSYPVSRSTAEEIISGYDETESFSDGSTITRYWWYSREDTRYEEDTHTWTFINKYHEAYIYGDVAVLELSKEATNHTDNEIDSISDKDLRNLADNKETTELSYYVWNGSMMMAYTAEAGTTQGGIVTIDAQDTVHGAHYVDLELYDNDDVNEHGIYYEGRKLNPDEYRISAVQMEDPVIYEWSPSALDTNENDAASGLWLSSETNTVRGDHSISLSGYVTDEDGTNGRWIDFAEIEDGTVTVYNGAAAEGTRIVFPSDIGGNKIRVNRVRENLHTNADRAEYGYHVYLVIEPSDAIVATSQQLFAEKDIAMSRVFNYVTSTLKYGDGDKTGQEIMQLDRWDASFLHGKMYKLAVELNKSIIQAGINNENDSIQYQNAISVVQQSNVEILTDFENACEDGSLPISRSGKIYDLLPPGMSADISSIVTNDLKARINNTNVIENYKNSGRELVIIDINLDMSPIKMRKDAPAPFNNPHEGDETYPQSGYYYGTEIRFNSYYSKEEAKNRGYYGRNTAAYEADEEEFGNVEYWTGEPDDPRAGNHKESGNAVLPYLRDLMTDLDPDADNPNFVYAGADYHLSEIDYHALTSIRKHVRADDDARWSYGLNNDVNIYENQTYTYRILLSTGAGTKTKDIIILDNIEDFVPMKITSLGDANDIDYTEAGIGEAKQYNVGDLISKRELENINDYLEANSAEPMEAEEEWYWKGTFKSLDVSGIEAMGVDPTVYYSTQNIDITNKAYNPGNLKTVVADILENSGDWTTVQPNDLSTVKAIAIDCRFDQNGDEFELEENESLIAYLHMIGPSHETQPEAFALTDYDDPLNNAHAYNNVYMDVTQIDEMNVETHSYNHFDYTKVGIKSAKLEVNKIWKDQSNNDNIRPENVTVHLYLDGVDTGRTVQITKAGQDGIENTDDDWKAAFDYVALYDENGLKRKFSFVEDDVEGYTAYYIINGNFCHIINTHVPETVTVNFRKVWDIPDDIDSTEVIPDQIVVILRKNGLINKTKIITPDANGNWGGEFTGVSKYSGGELNTYTVDEQAVENFITSIDNTTNTITNTYYPYGDLSVEKNVLKATNASKDQIFTFMIELKDENGDQLTGKYEYEIISTEDETVISNGTIRSNNRFELSDKQKIIITDLPTGCSYKISENSCPGFTNIQKVNDTGVISSLNRSEAVFTNQYSSMGEAVIEFEKHLHGKEELRKNAFEFEVKRDNLIPQTIKSPVPYESIGIDHKARMQAGGIRFTAVDDGKEIVYTIKEIARDDRPYYTYDPTEYIAKIYPHDDGHGKMNCEIEYYKKVETDGITEEIPVENVIFNNQYTATGELTLKAWKSLKGRQLVNEEFSFNLKNEDGEIIDTASNDEDGVITFSPLSFTQEDIGKTYYYMIEEVAGNDTTVNYDDSVYGYSVEVIDNEDGTLGFNQNYANPIFEDIVCDRCSGTGTIEEGGDNVACPDCEGTGTIKTLTGWNTQDAPMPVFRNTLKPGSMTISKFTSYTSSFTPDTNQTFNFKVRFLNAEDPDQEYTYELEKAGKETIVVTYDAGSGYFSGLISENTVTYKKTNNVYNVIDGEYQTPNREHYIFNGWVTDDGTVFDINNTPLQNITVHAKWKEKENMKYAVSVYHIGPIYDGYNVPEKIYIPEHDASVSRSTVERNAGITFGAAMGNYTQTYKAHIPTGTTKDGHSHRCIHEDEWETIIEWNHTDPYVYEQCMHEGCTKSIQLNSEYPAKYTIPKINGDGVTSLDKEFETINETTALHPRMWQSRYLDPVYEYYNNGYGGYRESDINIKLNGYITDWTRWEESWSPRSPFGRNDSSLYNVVPLVQFFPECLQNAMGVREIRYSFCRRDTESVPYSRVSYQMYAQLWIPSEYEATGAKALEAFKNNDNINYYDVDQNSAGEIWLRDVNNNTSSSEVNFPLKLVIDGNAEEYMTIKDGGAYGMYAHVTPCFTLWTEFPYPDAN